MNKSHDRYWRTSDLFLAAYLFGRGAIIAGVQARDHRAVFAFIDSMERQNWHDEFRSGIPMIDARIYIFAMQILRRRRYDAVMESHGQD